MVLLAESFGGRGRAARRDRLPGAGGRARSGQHLRPLSPPQPTGAEPGRSADDAGVAGGLRAALILAPRLLFGGRDDRAAIEDFIGRQKRGRANRPKGREHDGSLGPRRGLSLAAAHDSGPRPARRSRPRAPARGAVRERSRPHRRLGPAGSGDGGRPTRRRAGHARRARTRGAAARRDRLAGSDRTADRESRRPESAVELRGGNQRRIRGRGDQPALERPAHLHHSTPALGPGPEGRAQPLVNATAGEREEGRAERQREHALQAGQNEAGQADDQEDPGQDPGDDAGEVGQLARRAKRAERARAPRRLDRRADPAPRRSGKSSSAASPLAAISNSYPCINSARTPQRADTPSWRPPLTIVRANHRARPPPCSTVPRSAARGADRTSR